jgi:hypothetical protein
LTALVYSWTFGEGQAVNEEQWLSETEPRSLLSFLNVQNKLSHRKARLFSVAVCRRVWHLLPDDRSRNAVLVAERFADGEATREELAAAQAAIWGINCVKGTSAAQAAAAAARYVAGYQRWYSTLNAFMAARRAVELGHEGGLSEPVTFRTGGPVSLPSPRSSGSWRPASTRIATSRRSGWVSLPTLWRTRA